MTKSSVLLVEDNESIRTSLATLLELKGFEVAVAAHGQEALTLLRSQLRPSLILLDLMMPVMDGWTFLEEKARDPEIASLPVVLVSAVARLLAPSNSAGIVGSVGKPIAMDVLLPLLETYCRKSLKMVG